MNTFITKFEDLSIKIGSNQLLKTISQCFNMVLPIIIVGALFSLFSSIQIDAYQSFLTTTGIGNILSLVSKFTTELISIYVVYCFVYSYISGKGYQTEALLAGMFGIAGFMLLCPLSEIIVHDMPMKVITFDYLGSKGLFTALLTGFLVSYIYEFTLKHNIGIKMPDGVPPLVAKALSSLIPCILIMIIFCIITGSFMLITGVTFSEWFYQIISAPLTNLSSSFFTFALLQFLASLFWFFGIHGAQITMPIMMMLFLQGGLDNQVAYAAGEPLQNILTMGLSAVIILGGIGNTIGLNLNMLLFGKSTKYKMLGKLGIFPSIFNINEPIIFGFPIILNPIMALPFFIIPQITLFIAYITMKIGIVALPRLAMGALGIPMFVGGFMFCGITGLLLEILLTALSTACYYPFFKISDQIALKEETAASGDN